MGRVGISYLEVAQAATELMGKGINPTVDAVRERLGTGSKSTIGPYLKRWREQEGQGMGGNGETGLPSELASLVKGLYGRLQSEAALKIEEVIQNTQSELAEMRQTMDESNTRNASLEKKIHHLTIKLGEALETRSQYKLELEKELRNVLSLTTKTEEQEHRLQDKEQQAMVLEKQLANAQSNLEHYRESQSAQRKEESRVHEREIVLLQQQIQELKGQNIAIGQLNIDLKVQYQTIDKAKLQLEKEWYEQKGKTMELQESIRALESKNSDLKSELDDLSVDYRKLEDKLSAEIEKAYDFEKEALILQERLAISERTLTRAEDRVEKLTQEKLFLAQENWNLKADLKQFGQAMIHG